MVAWPSQPCDENVNYIDDEDPASKDLASSIVAESKSHFLQIGEDFSFINPHLALSIKWHGDKVLDAKPTDTDWRKWKPNQPTSSHWYTPEHLGRLIAAYVGHGGGGDRMVRGFISEFDGLAGSAKQKKVLESSGMAREPLSFFVDGHGLKMDKVSKLLAAMQEHTKPVKPARLGPIGKNHLRKMVEARGAGPKSFKYEKIIDDADGVPWIVETGFAYCPGLENENEDGDGDGMGRQGSSPA